MQGPRGNLLSVIDPSYQVEAKVEIEDLLSMIQAEARRLGPESGDTVTLLAREDPRKVVARLTYLHQIAPERFEFTRIWLPADRWCRSELGQIADLVSEVGEEIEDGESWKIALQRTDSPIDNIGKLIDTLSHCVLRQRGDLAGPQRIVYIHIIGEHTAVSLLRPEEMLKVPPRVHTIWMQDDLRGVAVG